MSEDAEREWFSILADFHHRVANLSLDVPGKIFEEATQGAIAKLGQMMCCPDIRIFLTSQPYRLPGDQDRPPEELTPERRIRFKMRWTTRGSLWDFDVAPDDATPLQWVLKHGRPLNLHNRKELPPGWLEGPQAVAPELGTVAPLTRSSSGECLPWWDDDTANACPSIMIHPVKVSDQTVGAIVCSYRHGPVYVFRARDRDGLALIAEILGYHWSTRLHRALARKDHRLLFRTNLAIGRFSDWLNRAFVAGKIPNDEECMQIALTEFDKIAGVPRFSSIRVPDKDDPKTLVFGPRNGRIWWTNAVVTERQKNATYRIERRDAETATSAAEYVLNAARAVIVDAENTPKWYRDTFKSHFLQAIFVPVYRSGDPNQWAGVVDIRCEKVVAFPSFLGAVLTQFSAQLGMTLGLLDRQRDIKRQQEVQLAVFKDLKHQLNLPQRLSIRYLEKARTAIESRNDPELSNVANDLFLAHAVSRRALFVGASTEHFVDLHRYGYIQQVSQRIKDIDIARIAAMLETCVAQQRALTDPGKRLHYVFDRDAFIDSAPAGFTIRGQPEVFEQLVTLLIENAEMHSFSDGEVAVGGLIRSDNVFVIDFSNTGPKIEIEEIPRLRQYGERGTGSSYRQSTGSGIGLWLADGYVKSFGGNLGIEPGSCGQPHHFHLSFKFK
jgi:signal transduction histidine kinase